MKNKFTLGFAFTTIKIGRGGSIKGQSGAAECEISADYTIDELKNMDNDLKNVAYQSLMSNPKAKKMGKIQSIDILTVSQVHS